MARKKATGPAPVASTVPVPEPAEPASPASSSASQAPTRPPPIPLVLRAADAAPHDPVKVNNASATELKIACDDAVKRFLAQPAGFKTIHLHTDVRLVLGWAAVIVSVLTGLYGWKTEFEASKPVVWAGVSTYVVLTSLQTLYAYFIEKNIVFEGRRRTLSRRIETERITLASKTLPARRGSAPRYELTVAYVQSTNSGKLLLGRGRESAAEGYESFFDSEGTMDQDAFDAWVVQVVARAMSGSAVDTPSLK